MAGLANAIWQSRSWPKVKWKEKQHIKRGRGRDATLLPHFNHLLPRHLPLFKAWNLSLFYRDNPYSKQLLCGAVLSSNQGRRA